jgi:hypothetical protein
MKNEKTMKRSLILFSSLLILLSSCDNPFRAGLGVVVDIRPPIVKLEEPGAGDYVWGSQRKFSGIAEDDYMIEKVELKITKVELKESNLPGGNPYKKFLDAYQPVTLKKRAQNKTDWELIIDTTQFIDGDLKILLKATDSEGKTAETDEIVFLVKNELPAITVAAPFIPRSDEDGGIGGRGRLNYNTVYTLPPSIGYPRQMDRRSYISGTISYDEDVFTGDSRGTDYIDDDGNHRYVPQIRFWPVGDGEGSWLPNELPSEAEKPWEDFVINETLFPLSVGSYQFIYQVPDETGRFYGFEIRAQRKEVRDDGVVKFHYPRDYWPDRLNSPYWDDPPINPTNPEETRFFIENRYVLIFVRTPSEYPEAINYGLEDILGQNGWNGTAYNDIPGVTDNMYHPYVNKLTVSKDGPFTLRIRTSHSEGILGAEAYWEKDDRSVRGRLIWDPAVTKDENDVPLPGLNADLRPIDTSVPYNQWGFRDPYDATIRSFIFTYRDGTESIPNTDQYHSAVRGSMKIQEYDKDASWQDWQEAKRSGVFPGQWEDRKTSLSEGVYYIEIYATSTQNTRMSTPHTNTVRLDWGAPEARITTIDGAYLQNLDANPPQATINGVVQPRLFFSDSRPQDSGVRNAPVGDEYYSYLDPQNPLSRIYGSEQRYLLIAKDATDTVSSVKMNSIIASSVEGARRYWPPIPLTIPTSGNSALKFDDTTIPGVKIYRHGAIFNSNFMFKSSKIYGSDVVDENELEDGEYWLYVFVRDNAFNVGRITPLLVTVDHTTDIPKIDFMGGSINDDVKDPSVSADDSPIGFIYDGSARNQFGLSSTLRLRLVDDDSLDLGMDVPDDDDMKSKVVVTFSGAKSEAGEIKALSDDPVDGDNYLIKLTDAEVKGLFRPQSSGTLGGRQAVRTRDGSISQTFLLDKLKASPAYVALGIFAPKGGPAAYNVLPDGIYRISVFIEDYAPAKLKLPGETADPLVRSDTINVWIAIDTTNPAISVTDKGTSSDAGWISPIPLYVNGVADGTTGITIKGTLSDINGPVKVTGFTIEKEEGGRGSDWDDEDGVELVYTKKEEVRIVPAADVPNTTQWKADFEAPVHIALGISAKFVVTLQVTDRFGRTSSEILRYQIDTEPPTVVLRKPIDTFERDDPDRVYQTNKGDITQENRKRLANGIASFNISASDNLKVAEVRWWLLPNGTPFSGWNTPTSGVKHGQLTDNFGRSNYIDTKDLDDYKEYDLYVMAIDDVPNYSDISIDTDTGKSFALLDTIYVLQKEDKPYFGQNNLQGVVGEQNMRVRFTVNDDDGFSVPAGQGLAARPGSVRIWMKKTSADPAAGFNPDSLTDSETTDWTAPATITSGVTLMGKNISLNIDLSTTNNNAFATILGASGKKHYVIEVTDSWNGKFINENGTLATSADVSTQTVFWREYYSFVLDNKAPVIAITMPTEGDTFGEIVGGVTLNKDFSVKGSISDAYLKKTADNNYFIGLRVGTGTSTEIKLGTGSGNGFITGVTTTSGDIVEETVAFTIPAIDFLPMIGYSGQPDTTHTLVFTAEDQSGKTGSFSLKFVKDTTAPALTFTDIANISTAKTPQPLDPDWWTAVTINPDKTSPDYVAKRALELPVISHDGSPPSITGTFNDLLSSIDKTSFKIKFDNDPTEHDLSAQLEGEGKVVRWRVYLTQNGTNTNAGTPQNPILTDGVHSIQLTIKDIAGNELIDPTMYGFRINSEQPESTITKLTQTVYGDRTGAGINDIVFTISGTGTSRNLSDVRVKIRNGNTSFERPVLLIPPATDPFITNNTWHFVREGAAPLIDVQETLNWTLSVTRDYILRAAGITTGTGTMKAGNYDVVVTAVDRAGKNSEETDINVWSFVIDSGAPTFNFTNLQLEPNPPAATDNALPVRAPAYWLTNATAARNVLTSTEPAVKGRVSDPDASDLGAVELQLAKWNYSTGAWTIYKFTDNTWSASNTTNVTNSDHWSGFNVTASPSPEYIVDWAFTTVAAEQLTDGYYSVRLRARDVSTAAGGTGGWAAGNNGNPAYSPYAYFFIDRAPPLLENPSSATATVSSRYITATNTPYRPRYGLEFKVTASDANGFEKMVVTVERINTTGGTLPNGNSTTIPGSSNPLTILYPTPAAQTGTWTNNGDGTYTVSAMLAFTPKNEIPATGSGNQAIPATGSDSSGLPDGAYRIVFTATDLAGKTARETRTITLDNRAPTGVIEEPRFVGGDITQHDENGEVTPRVVIHRFASATDVKIGGENFVITGSTDDIGDNGSASGPAGIWYRIGYGTQAKDSLPEVTSTMTAAQRSAAIMRWAVNNGSGLTGVTADTGAAFNKNFDDASKSTNGSLWFKYKVTGDSVTETYPDGATSTNVYDRPTNFADIMTADLYKWLLNASATGANSVATTYAVGTVAMRGSTYTNGAAGTRYLARAINENELQLGLRRGGLYSLPLVIRVVDNAGNVFYELRDIWLFPNGDSPSSVIINPSARFTGYTGGANARGGQMQIQGIASDNKSVRTVLYRVKVDNTPNLTATPGIAPTGDGTYTIASNGSVTGSGPIVLIPGADRWEDHREYGTAATSTVLTGTGMLGKWNSYSTKTGTAADGDNVTGIDGTTKLTQTGWYMAKLESTSVAPTMPWDFMLNKEGEINALITAGKGFTYNSNNYIRVWVEVLVFDGEQPTASSLYNRMSLGDDNPDATKPRPYVREFYFTTSAPNVTTPQISNLGSTTAFSNYTSPLAANNVRSGNFALRATLNGNSNDIGQISVRLTGETNSDWRPVYVRADGASAVKTVNGVSLGTWTGGTRTATLTYTFDSTRTTSTTALQAVRAGAWATTGGTFTVDVRVRDTSNPPAEAVYTFEVGVDNFVPVADRVRTITPTKVAGEYVSFLGRVFDYQGIPGTPQPDHKGIKDVRVWFMTRDSTNTTPYINMSTGARANAATAGAGTATTGIWTTPGATVAYNGDTVTSVTKTTNPNPATASRNIPTAANFVKVLSESEGGITWSPTNNWDIFWSFNVNTTNFPDGWMTMHYVVTDHANNRSYYTQEMVVMNHSPRITNVTLYTNNTGEGAVFTTHDGNDAYSDYPLPADGNGLTIPYASGYLDSGFISKNMVIGFGVDTMSGNAPLNYQVRYVERYRVPLTNNNLLSMARRANLSTKNSNGSVTFTPNGTATVDDKLHYYNDSNVLVETESVNSFANIYTIATGSGINLSAGVWRILGVPSVTPSDGSHFVFQGVEIADTGNPLYGVDNNVVPMAFDDVYVYAYKEVIPKASVSRASPNHNTIPPESLFFNGANDFDVSAAAKINEAMAINATNASASNPNGTAFFLIKVWDTVDGAVDRSVTGFTEKDMLYDAIVIGMRVYLNDTARPFARLYDLNPYTETDVVGSNIGAANRNQTLNEAAAPAAIGANILRGGLYNLGTPRAPIKSGYIDPRNGTTALYPYVNNPSDAANPYLGSLRAEPDGFVEGDTVAAGSVPDKVSGNVILRGLAWDDQLIDTISVTIGDTSKTILQLQYVRVVENSDGSKTETIVPANTTGGAGTIVRKMMPVRNVTGVPNPTTGTTYTYTSQTAWTHEEINWKTGHTVEWAYLWDTEAEPTGRARGGPLSTTVTVTVQDLKGRGANNSRLSNATVTTSAASPPTSFHNTVGVDIVPYITGFRRQSPKFATTRSRQGWYSFFRGEENIAVLGYNLGTSITDSNSGTRIFLATTATGNGTSLYNADTRRYTTNTNMPNDGHVFSIPTNATSGRMNVTVSGTAAWNHSSSHVNKSWNTEKGIYTNGSDLWNNKPHAHIWRTNQENSTPVTYFGANERDTASMENPAMTLEYGTTGGSIGRLHGTWGVRSTFGLYYGVNDGATNRTTLQTAQDPLVLPDIDYFPGAANANNRTITAIYEWDGLPSVIINTNILNNGHRDDVIRPNLVEHTRAGNVTDVTASDRYQNPRIRMAAANVNTGDANNGSTQNVAGGNAGRVYVSVYDSVNKSVYYLTRAGNTIGRVYVDGGGAVNGVNNTNTWGNVGDGATGASTSTRAGNWSAVDYVTNGGTNGTTTVPVIAYYDETNDTLRLAYGSSETSSGGGGSWTRRYVLSSTDTLFRGSGKYVSMKVDKNNFIHLAFFNSSKNTMVYAVGTRTGNFTAVAVDNVVTGGTWTDISVDNSSTASVPANPWIVYGDSGRTGNYDGVRIAYKDAAYTRTLDDPLSGNSIAGWEALTMPANYTISDDRLNIESWPPTDRGSNTAVTGTASPNGSWHAAVGYAGTNRDTNTRMFRLGYFFKPAAAVMTGGTWQQQ